MVSTHIQMKIDSEDKIRFQQGAKQLCLTLSGFLKLAGSEKLKKMEAQSQ